MSDERQKIDSSDRYLWDGSGEPDPEVQRLEALLGGLRHDEPLEMVVPNRRRWLPAVALLAAAAAIAVVVGKRLSDTNRGHTQIGPRVVEYNRSFASTGPGVCAPENHDGSWGVVQASGAPSCGGTMLPEVARLPIGEWLETREGSSAKLQVADIGHVTVRPNTKVRLLQTKKDEHRLQLERGSIHAFIAAPPRLFFVETPSAVAVDLGCAYDLNVDEKGAGHLHVTLGYVSFERDGRESLVPAGNMCDTRPGVGPGSPYAATSSEALRKALRKLDFQGGTDADLAVVIAEAKTKADTITLWHLMIRSQGERQRKLYDALARLAPPPEGVNRDAIAKADKDALAKWRATMEDHWFHEETGTVDPDDL